MKLSPHMRPFITAAFVGLTVYLTLAGKVEPREILTVTGMIVSFWFGERAALKQPSNDEKE